MTGHQATFLLCSCQRLLVNSSENSPASQQSCMSVTRRSVRVHEETSNFGSVMFCLIAPKRNALLRLLGRTCLYAAGNSS